MNKGEEKEAFLLIFVLYKIGRGGLGGGRAGNGMTAYLRKYGGIDRFESRGQQLCKLLGIKESFSMRKAFNSHRIFFVYKHGRRFIVLCTNIAAVTSCENDLYSCSIIL